LRTETAGKRIARGATSVASLLSSVVNRAKIAAKDRADAREQMAGVSVQERQDDLVRFYDRYESLVETLCDAAQYGPTPRLERAYAEAKAHYAAEYKSVRPFVVAFLQFTNEDAEAMEKHPGSGTDGFELLVAGEDLNEFLRMDDGNMITRITRTREALSLYGEHLRQLASRAA
jgi:hypothetical protein